MGAVSDVARAPFGLARVIASVARQSRVMDCHAALAMTGGAALAITNQLLFTLTLNVTSPDEAEFKLPVSCH